MMNLRNVLKNTFIVLSLDSGNSLMIFLRRSLLEVDDDYKIVLLIKKWFKYDIISVNWCDVVWLYSWYNEFKQQQCGFTVEKWKRVSKT